MNASRDSKLKVLTHSEDVDGLVSAALVLKKFPRAEIETGAPQTEMSGEYDIVVDLPLPEKVETQVWIDHHRKTVREGEAEEEVYDQDAKSAAGLLAKYLGLEDDDLVQFAERADSANYLTEAPIEMEGDYDPAWDVNDIVKAISTEEQFVELAETLAFKDLDSVREKFWNEISETRGLRRKASEIVQLISQRMKEENSDAPIIIMPSGELNTATVSGHVVFSLYQEGAKVCAVFYEGGCWLNSRKDFDGLDVSEVMVEYGGGGHRKSAGAPIGDDKVGEIADILKEAGLSPLIIDLKSPDSDNFLDLELD